MRITCLDCGKPIRKGSPYSRCELHRRPYVVRESARQAAKHRELGYGDPDVKAAMAAARARDGACRFCGTTADLTVHYMPGGPHSATVSDYLTLCRRCHGRIDGGRASRAGRMLGA